MNLLTMLNAAAKHKNGLPSTTRQRYNLEACHRAKTLNAMNRYRKAFGGDWLSTYELECRLGYGRTVANVFLRKLLALGAINRRPRGGGAYVRTKGWEWQWTWEGPTEELIK